MTTRPITIASTYPLSQNTTASKLLWICAFCALTCAGARIQIPTLPVPMTLQTPIVLLAGALLGARAGALSQLMYLALGAVGLPVFAFGGGLAYLGGPTGGYLLAFPLAAWLCGTIVHSAALRVRWSSFWLSLVAMIAGLAVIFALGMLRLKTALALGWEDAFVQGFASLQIWDAVKITSAALLASVLLRDSAK